LETFFISSDQKTKTIYKEKKQKKDTDINTTTYYGKPHVGFILRIEKIMNKAKPWIKK